MVSCFDISFWIIYIYFFGGNKTSPLFPTFTSPRSPCDDSLACSFSSVVLERNISCNPTRRNPQQTLTHARSSYAPCILSLPRPSTRSHPPLLTPALISPASPFPNSPAHHLSPPQPSLLSAIFWGYFFLQVYHALSILPSVSLS